MTRIICGKVLVFCAKQMASIKLAMASNEATASGRSYSERKKLSMSCCWLGCKALKLLMT